MAQCKAATAAGSQCVFKTVAPSRSLCKRHQTVLTTGKSVINFESGRKFPARVAAAPVKAKRVAKARATTARASAPRAVTPARTPRVARAAAVAVAKDDAPREPRALGEHSLMCNGPRCANIALPGSNYCMTHQRLA